MNEYKKKIEQLKNTINKHNELYYVKSTPEITDFEYDKLINELIELETKFPEYLTSDSPTQKVGSDKTNKFNRVKHKLSMKSLENTYNENDIKNWYNRIQKFLSGEKIEFILELKIDGVAASLIYEKGKFVKAVSRGDGVYGDDITLNIKTIKTLPLEINYKELSEIDFDVRCEVYMSKKVFNKLNKNRELDGKDLFANPRNAASGSLKQLDSKICADRKLDFFVHSIGYIEKPIFSSQFEFYEILKNTNLKINEYTKKIDNINDVLEYCKYWEKHKDSLDYEIDGMVIKVNSLKQQEILGYTAKFPRFAIAYKFAAEQAETKIYKVDFQVGRLGYITPVANFEPPVHLAGTMVKRATLHNYDFIKELDVRLNDTVVVEKSGEIIPVVVKVLKEKRTGNESIIKTLEECPICKNKVFKFENDVKSKCVNPECSAQIVRRIEHFCSKTFGVDINIGIKTIEMLVEKKILKSIADLYFIKKEDLIGLERFGNKSANNLIKSILNSKSKSFEHFLSGLGIPMVGNTVAEIITDYYPDIDKLMNADKKEMANIENIGEKIADSVYNFFKIPQTQELIRKFKTCNLNLKKQIELNKNNLILNGLSFVITGKLPSGKSRTQLKEIIKKNGGKIHSSISKKTSYLITSNKTSNSKKMRKAIEFNLKIIDEEEFYQLINKS